MNKKATTVKQSPGGLKEIREIIFGDMLQSLQDQINELKRENTSLKDQLKHVESDILKSATQINELSTKQNGSNSELNKLNKFVESMQSDLEEKIKDLKVSKIGKNQIGQAFIEWGMKVKQNSDS